MMMSDDGYCPSPQLLQKLQRLATANDNDTGTTSSDCGEVELIEQDEGGQERRDRQSGGAAAGQPAIYRPVRRWRPSAELAAVGGVGAPPSD
eukprot:COSAG06_NODE_43764_length_369_cov_0.737037_1_plen_91_part_10